MAQPAMSTTAWASHAASLKLVAMLQREDSDTLLLFDKIDGQEPRSLPLHSLMLKLTSNPLVPQQLLDYQAEGHEP